LLLAPDSLLHKWCDPEKIKNLIEQNRNGVMAAEHHLYKLLSTQIWLNECIAVKKA
jgi:asparagine synthase (glutamine-hydrolysing)